MNRTKEFTTPSNITLEEFIIQTSTNGWILQIKPTLSNILKQLTSSISEYFSVMNLKKKFSENDLQEGKVKFFNKTKRFGFITTGKKDIFVHISGLKDNIRSNDRVVFEIENGQNGLTAVNVRLSNAAH